jgi:hypothetical protein
MLFRMHAELLYLPTAEEIKDNGRIGDWFIQIILDDNFDGSPRR